MNENPVPYRAPGHAPIAFGPTPLHEAERLSEALGVRVLVKRDDQTGLALGGNKARKLALLVEDAIRRGCDTLVAAGGAQSNFARMTAAAAAVAGLHCELVLGGNEPSRWSGNLLLDRLLGARVHFAGSENWLDILRRTNDVAADLGSRAYAMPIGGSTPVGALAYLHAAGELLEQMSGPPDWIVVADGTGGTHAGLLAGLPAGVRVLGVDVSRPPLPLVQTIAALAAETAALGGRPAPGGEVLVVDHCGPHYGSITGEAREAVRLAARTEGLILDPVYTGKAMAGLVAAAREGRVRGTVVFWHTGGAPGLFADEYADF
ncbi:D-cysteine desulfhydrase family protein [bacterium]|nr:D-cysteine desulfhydrase family protein [bacterium]